jgi:hypothetical protein
LARPQGAYYDKLLAEEAKLVAQLGSITCDSIRRLLARRGWKPLNARCAIVR